MSRVLTITMKAATEIPTLNASTDSDVCPACGHSTADVSMRANGFDLLRCGACGLVFVPSAQVRAVNYDELYQSDGDYSEHVAEVAAWKRGERIRYGKARRVTLAELEKLKPSTMLEIGCGVGSFLKCVGELGTSCWGTDASSAALQHAKELVSCPLQQGLFGPAIFPGLRFQVICTWEVLEHVHDVRLFLQNIRDRLVPGGWLYLSTPNYASTWVWNDIPADPRGRPPVHVTYWTKASLTSMLQRLGFRDILIREMSLPISHATRTPGGLRGQLAYVDSLLRRRQRRTLLCRARVPD